MQIVHILLDLVRLPTTCCLVNWMYRVPETKGLTTWEPENDWYYVAMYHIIRIVTTALWHMEAIAYTVCISEPGSYSAITGSDKKYLQDEYFLIISRLLN